MAERRLAGRGKAKGRASVWGIWIGKNDRLNKKIGLRKEARERGWLLSIWGGSHAEIN